MVNPEKIHIGSKTYVESDALTAKRTGRPIRDAGIGRFAERLKEAMQGQGLRAFGKKCGLSEGALHSYLSGDTFPTLDRLDAIAAATGHPPGWFIGVQPKQEAVSQPERLDRETLRLAAQVLERALESANASTDSAGRAELLVAIYELLEQGAAQEAAQRVVATMLRAASKAAGVPSKQG